MSEPAGPAESEIAFLRSQVAVLSTRLCDTLTQQVAQQQTVLIASMQTNLALTQTVDRLNRVVDGLSENLELLQREREAEEPGSRAAPGSGAGSDFASVIAALAPVLLGAASKPDQVQKEPPPFALPKEVLEQMRKREPAASPANETTVRKAQSKKDKPREDAT
jgi:hypothetical protein